MLSPREPLSEAAKLYRAALADPARKKRFAAQKAEVRKKIRAADKRWKAEQKAQTKGGRPRVRLNLNKPKRDPTDLVSFLPPYYGA